MNCSRSFLSAALLVATSGGWAASPAPEYFMLRPEVEKAFGYAHAVRIGDEVRISGAVSMDDAGNPTAVGDLAQQMRNVYADLERILAH